MVRFSSKVSIFAGGSFSAKSGFSPGSTSDANWLDDNIWEMANTLGNIYGSSCASFICPTSSTDAFNRKKKDH